MGYNMKYEDYNDCLYIVWNRDNDGNLISVKIDEEPHVVSRSMCMLKGIPDKFYRVLIDGMIEVEDKPNLEKNEFEVDYTYGLIRFNEIMNDKVVTIKRYYSRGNYYYPSSRIYYKINPIDGTVVTMYDIIEKVREELMIATDNARKMNDTLNITIGVGKQVNIDLLAAIELARKLITELGVDQYVKHADTGNGDGKIPISNGTVNTNLNADMVDGKHAIDLANKVHTHIKSDITDFPTKLPADGGNSDTVGGKTIEEIAPKVHTHLKKDITDMNLKTVAETGSYNDLIDKPLTLPADGGNSNTVGGKGVNDFIQNTDNTNILKSKWDNVSASIKFNKNTDLNTIPVEKALHSVTSDLANNIGDIAKSEIVLRTKGDLHLYVDVNKGSNSNDGTQLRPFKTIQYAFDVSPRYTQHSVTIHVAEGIYNENIETGGFLGKYFKLMADTEDYNKVVIKGIFRNEYSLGNFIIANISFIPDPLLISPYIIKNAYDKTVLFLVQMTGCNFPSIVNCNITQTGVSVDYLYGIHFESCKGRVKDTRIRSMYGKIRGVGVMSDNASDIFCWNCDINGTTICYYAQAATIRVYNPIEPPLVNKDYTYLKFAEVNGNAY